MEQFFPALSDSSLVKEYYNGLQQYNKELLRSIVTGEGWQKVRMIENNLLQIVPPSRFDGNQSVEVQNIKAYEASVAVMSQHLSRDPKKMTVLEFYQALEELQSQWKAQEKKNGK